MSDPFYATYTRIRLEDHERAMQRRQLLREARRATPRRRPRSAAAPFRRLISALTRFRLLPRFARVGNRRWATRRAHTRVLSRPHETSSPKGEPE